MCSAKLNYETSWLENLKGKYPEGTQTSAASSDWFAQFKSHSGFYNVEVSEETIGGNLTYINTDLHKGS